MTDPLKLGFHQMAMSGVRCDGAQLVRAAEEIAALPEISYAVLISHRYITTRGRAPLDHVDSSGASLASWAVLAARRARYAATLRPSSAGGVTSPAGLPLQRPSARIWAAS
ncbi:MAG: hypothetical protein ACLQBX_09825 [Candidatus Limnocylindrales bacterium]